MRARSKPISNAARHRIKVTQGGTVERGAPVPTMIVLVNLKEGVTPEEYESWLQERYVPAILDLASVDEWRGYRVVGLPESGGDPPYRYVVSVGINDLRLLGKDMESEQVQRLLGELGRYADVTQLMTERFV
jgi:REDY-like protein HapK